VGVGKPHSCPVFAASIGGRPKRKVLLIDFRSTRQCHQVAVLITYAVETDTCYELLIERKPIEESSLKRQTGKYHLIAGKQVILTCRRN